MAIGQYSLWRDLLNATGKPVHFSLCGWEEWYAPPDPSIGYGGGASVGNQFRIAGGFTRQHRGRWPIYHLSKERRAGCVPLSKCVAPLVIHPPFPITRRRRRHVARAAELR